MPPLMPMDVTEGDQGFAIDASLPGYTRDQISVNVDTSERILTVSANKTERTESGGLRYHRCVTRLPHRALVRALGLSPAAAAAAPRARMPQAASLCARVLSPRALLLLALCPSLPRSRERFEQSQTRSMRLPDNADVSKIASNLQNGVLHITVPKTVGSTERVRRIAVA